MQVRDNGCGIAKDQLGLAITQHATSKITAIADLGNLSSLGFRGEALASIGSVAKLSIVSKPDVADIAWSIAVAGADSVMVQEPLAHGNGTTIAMRELFFNVPVRRKFLRTIKTETQYCETVFKAIILSNFSIAFSCKRDSGKMRTFPACLDKVAMAKRIATVCGKSFMANAIYIESATEQMQISGWFGLRAALRAQNDLQYCYINGRIIKDKLVNHAVREAYKNAFPEESISKLPACILFLKITANLVDVNVHPTKHEVRFVDARGVHAFIANAIFSALTNNNQVETAVSAPEYNYSNIPLQEFIPVTERSAIIPIYIIETKILLVARDLQLICVDLQAVRKLLYHTIAAEQLQQNNILATKPLLMPQQVIVVVQDTLGHLGFSIGSISPTASLVRAVPEILQDSDCDYLELLTDLQQATAAQHVGIIIAAAAKVPDTFTLAAASELLQQLERYNIDVASVIPGVSNSLGASALLKIL